MSSPLSYSLGSVVRLNNGVSMPRIHLGAYMTSGSETTNAVVQALEAGYLAVDSAEWYANEREVGSGMAAFLSSHGDAKRGDLWFTTKLRSNESYDATRKAVKQSIRRSGLGYIDLYLLHSPYGGKRKRLECWRAVEDAIEDGEVRVGGVSNYGVKHLQELLESKPRHVPAVNQIEVHPFNTQIAITSFCQAHGIVVQAYAPLVQALRMKHTRIVELSRKYECTPAQLLIRWSLQHGYVPLPKSVSRARIIVNGQVEGFDIGAEDMRAMDDLDEHLVTDWDPTDAE